MKTSFHCKTKQNNRPSHDRRQGVFKYAGLKSQDNEFLKWDVGSEVAIDFYIAKEFDAEVVGVDRPVCKYDFLRS